MEDINATDLTAETLSSLDGAENVVLFDTAEGKKVSLDVLAEYVVTKATETLLGSSQTVAAALSALNSKAYRNVVSYGIYQAADHQSIDLAIPNTIYIQNNNSVYGILIITDYNDEKMDLYYLMLGGGSAAHRFARVTNHLNFAVSNVSYVSETRTLTIELSASKRYIGYEVWASTYQ